jgi:ABC-type Zn2+ transport system substrate-binding protein/surface adhesin
VIWVGGPKLEALLLTESQLKADLDGMEFVVLQEIERDVREGDHANNSQNNSHCNNDDNDGNGDDDEENRNNNHHHNNIIIIIITTIMIGILHTGHAAVIQCLGVKSG